MSNYKHFINEIVSMWLMCVRKRPLRILETHQGEGKATEKYRKYGSVVGFEKDREKYYRIRKRFRDAFSVDECLKEQELIDIAEKFKTDIGYPILIPLFPTDSTAIIPSLRARNCIFDVVDVDPYGSPRHFIPMVFDVLDNKSILFLTSGEMHYVRFQPQNAMAPYKIQANQGLRSTQKFFRDDNILIVGAWAIMRGLEKSIGLYPFFIHDYYTGYSGVHRIGFFVKKKIDVFEKSKIREQLISDPILRVRIIACCFEGTITEDKLTAWRFSSGASKEDVKKIIIKKLDYLNMD